MTIKTSQKLESALGVIFDFITSKDFISRYGTKRPMKCTMLSRNRSNNRRPFARPRAHGGPPVRSSAFGSIDMLGLGQREKGV